MDKLRNDETRGEISILKYTVGGMPSESGLCENLV